MQHTVVDVQRSSTKTVVLMRDEVRYKGDADEADIEGTRHDSRIRIESRGT